MIDVKAVWITARPWQWLKNVLVFAPLIFARRWEVIEHQRDAWLAFVALCFVSSAGYFWNDLRDREPDRRHPRKQGRPVAAGRLSARSTLLVSLFLAAVGMVASVVADEPGSIGVTRYVGGYLALTVTYSAWWKRIPFLDVVVIAIGFLLRVYAGGSAVDVEVSPWLACCTFFGALFVSLGKRDAEVRETGTSVETRATLLAYDHAWLAPAIVISGLLLLVTYGAYTLSARAAAEFGPGGMRLTLPFAVAGVLRYAWLIRRSQRVEDPARLFLSDPWMVAIALFWTGTVVWVLRSAGGFA